MLKIEKYIHKFRLYDELVSSSHAFKATQKSISIRKLAGSCFFLGLRPTTQESHTQYVENQTQI